MEFSSQGHCRAGSLRIMPNDTYARVRVLASLQAGSRQRSELTKISKGEKGEFHILVTQLDQK